MSLGWIFIWITFRFLQIISWLVLLNLFVWNKFHWFDRRCGTCLYSLIWFGPQIPLWIIALRKCADFSQTVVTSGRNNSRSNHLCKNSQVILPNLKSDKHYLITICDILEIYATSVWWRRPQCGSVNLITSWTETLPCLVLISLQTIGASFALFIDFITRLRLFSIFH